MDFLSEDLLSLGPDAAAIEHTCCCCARYLLAEYVDTTKFLTLFKSVLLSVLVSVRMHKNGLYIPQVDHFQIRACVKPLDNWACRADICSSLTHVPLDLMNSCNFMNEAGLLFCYDEQHCQRLELDSISSIVLGILLEQATTQGSCHAIL